MFSLNETPNENENLDPRGVSGFIQVTIRVWIISSWATSNPTTCVYHIFSGLWFGLWSGYRQAKSHDSVNEVNFQKINISQYRINYSQSCWMDNTTFCMSASVIFFAFKQLPEIKVVLWEVLKKTTTRYCLLNYCCICLDDILTLLKETSYPPINFQGQIYVQQWSNMSVSGNLSVITEIWKFYKTALWPWGTIDH